MTSDSPRAKSDVIEELPEYRPLSFAAIAAVLLALPGCLGVFHSGFLLFPMVAIALALIALRPVASSSSSISGRRAAWTALFLSILVICFSITLHALNSRREYLYAVNCAEQWLRLLRSENPQEAYLLTMAYDQRPARTDETVRTEFGTSRSPLVYDSPETFLDKFEIKALADPGNPIKLSGLAGREWSGKRAVYRLAFDFHAAKLTPPDYFAIVETARTPGVGGGNYWQITSYQLIAKNSGAQLR